MITELTLRLHGIPEYTIAARATFPDVDAAVPGRDRARRRPASRITRVELLDELTLRACNTYMESAYAEAPSLFLEFGGERGAA